MLVAMTSIPAAVASEPGAVTARSRTVEPPSLATRRVHSQLNSIERRIDMIKKLFLAIVLMWSLYAPARMATADGPIPECFPCPDLR